LKILGLFGLYEGIKVEGDGEEMHFARRHRDRRERGSEEITGID
jgi:hypothetical protein